MNKPIRTISIFCLLLFLALMVNATYLQYCKAGALNDDPLQPPGDRGGVLPASAARSWSAATPSPRAWSPTTSTSSSAVPQAAQVRPGHRLLLLLQPDRHRAVAERRALRRRLAAVRHPAASTCSATPSPRAAASSSPSTPTAQQAAYDGLRGLGPGVQGSVVAIEPTHRQDPGDGLAADVRPQRAGHPRLRRRSARSGPTSSTDDRASRWSTAPSRPGCLPARRSSSSPRPPRSRAATTTADSEVPGGPTYQLPADQRPDRPDRQRGPRLRQPTGSRSSRRWRTPATPRSPQLAVEVGAEADAGAAEAFGFNSHYLDDLARRPSRSSPTDIERAADRPDRHRPVRGGRRRRCRWRWSPPASPTAAR